MAVQQGYGKAAGANSLVFAYDITDTRNSFKGEPTVNLYGDINTSSSIRPSRTEYDTSNWVADFPAPPENIGRVYKHTSGALNSTWSGNSYGYTLKGYNYLANVTYTLSAWVYVSADCNITGLGNSMEGTTVTDTTNRNYNLNNKGTWQQLILKCNSATSISGNAIPVYPSRSGVTDGSFSGFYAWGGAKLEALNRVTPYTVGTRSNTEALLDLTGNHTVDVSTLDFTEGFELDGTNDHMTFNLTKTPNMTFEFITNFSGNVTTGQMVFNAGNSGSGPDLYMACGKLNWNIWDGCNNPFANIPGSWDNGKNHHVVLVNDQTNNISKLYYDGVLLGTATYRQCTADRMSIGGDGASYNYQGNLPIFKIYNAALTESQVLSNFNNYRKRFEGLDYYIDDATDGGGWIRWWWYTGVGWPGHETEALGHPFGTFDSSSHYGFQRLPEGLNKDSVELLAKDGDGNIYKWDFADTSGTAQRVWDSFTQGTQGVWANNGAFMPTVIAGGFHGGVQDTWQYRVSEGVASFLLDDDSCDCISTLNAGHAMCGGSGWSQTYAQPDGAYLRYGVDTLNDGGCLGPIPTRRLELFYRLK